MAMNDTTANTPVKKRFLAQYLAEWRTGLVGRLVGESFRAYWRLYAVAIGAMVLMAASAGAMAWVMERIIDVMTTPDERRAVYAVAGTVILIFAVRGASGYLQAVYLARAGNRIVANQQDKLYRKLLKHGVTFYNDMESSDLLMRFTVGAQAARALVDVLVIGFVRDLLTMVFLLMVMFYQQPALSMIILIVGPIAFWGIRQLLLTVRSIMEQEMMSLAEIIKVVQETSAGIQIIKIFGLEDRLIKRMDKAIRAVEARSNAIVRLQAITNPLMDTLAGFAIASVVVVSAFGFGTDEPATPGQLISFVTALLMMYEPGKRVSRMRIQIEANMVGVRMMFELLDRDEPMKERADASELKPGKGRVEFRDVSYQYRENTPVLKQMNLVFEEGKTSALVGQSGGGKSTVAAMVMRFFDPDEGTVVINGQDICNVTFDSLRAKISYVGQDTFLFGTSVMENLRCSKMDASDDDIMEAAKSANAHEFIEKLPQGYDTLVGENGAFLSGGQKQRLAIARAILRKSEVLLLDEATSALDTESETLVKNALKRLSEGRTTIVIAHRLSTIMEADKIFVVHQGEIAEEGSPKALLELEGGAFRNLFEHQFQNNTQTKTLAEG
jgi:subfamily B ATP-binding cassette protein MsbA